MDIQKQIKKDLEKTIIKVFGDKVNVDKIYLEIPEDSKYGDYSSNFALIKFSDILMPNIKTPLVMAQKIAGNFPEKDYLQKIEAISPGFINFYIKPKFFIPVLNKILKNKDQYGSNKIGKRKTVVIDYSAPNIAKPFSIGHLRSTIIGQAIYNLYKFSGYKAIGDNHIGDWGTQFGKLIVAIKKWSSVKKLPTLLIKDLVNLYIQFHKQAEEYPEFNKQAQLWFKKLEKGDKEAKKIWQKCIDISWQEFNKIYDILDIKIDYAFGESFYKNKTANLIKQAKKEGIAKKSQGALIIEVNEKMPPLILLKSDGATTYHTRDLATIQFRTKKFKPCQIIYEVGAEQSLHFKQLFIAAQKFDWGKNIEYKHIAHGLMRLPSGKMSTRKGKIIFLEDILKQAIEKSFNIVEQNNPNMSFPEKQKLAKAIGVGAVKYNDLCQHYSKNIVFNWNKVLNLQGNSGPYIQYTYTRALSILRKARATQLAQLKRLPDEKQIKTKEINILKHLSRFPEIVEKATISHSPNLICNYTFELCQKFNNFYETIPVLKAEDKKLQYRLVLVKSVTQVIKNCLNLLGIEVIEKM